MKIIKISIIVILLIVCNEIFAQNAGEICYNPSTIKDTTKKSIKSVAFSIVNGDSIKITYHSPGVRKRIIWGGLVPYDEVWVTGAHDATKLEMPKSFIIKGKEIPAGTYAIFTIPGEKEWIIIINKKWKQHLASEYEEEDDVIRVPVSVQKIEHKERLQYFIEMTKSDSGKISVEWEKIKIELPFQIKL